MLTDTPLKKVTFIEKKISPRLFSKPSFPDWYQETKFVQHVAMETNNW